MKPDIAYRKGPDYRDNALFPSHASQGIEQDIMADMEIRAELCAALADISESMRALLGLMSRHNFITVLPDKSFPAYENIMGRIGTAVSQASQAVEQSRTLDKRITLAHLPPAALPRQ